MVQTESSFLDLVDVDPSSIPEQPLLPHEAAVVDQAALQLKEKEKELFIQKNQNEGGDDWHDGAYRTTDAETNRVWKEQLELRQRFMGATIFQYPAANETRVTLGSRATLMQNGYPMVVDIVGYRTGYPDGVMDATTNEEVVGVSPETPVAKAILGKVVGEVVKYNPGAREFMATITAINQTAVREYFLAQAGVQAELAD
jgi:transcription elongation GreA/GreB family factor